MTLSILGISGSLRRESFNTRLLQAATALMPADATLTVRTLHGVPLYDGDLEAQGMPDGVRELREAIRAADGLLLSTPEYNNGVPGVLKNAIDWASRGADQPLAHKPLALLSASPGGMGGVRAQLACCPRSRRFAPGTCTSASSSSRARAAHSRPMVRSRTRRPPSSCERS